MINHRTLEESIRFHVRYSLAKDWHDVSKDDLFHAISLAVKERAVDQMLESERAYRERDVKRVYYFSLEFLVGRTLGNNLLNLGLMEECREAVKTVGYDLNEVMQEETDPALGNGGLGRLAACYLDSMATLGVPGFGYGINYQFGLFKQTIENGYQKEKPDRWLADGVYWQITRPEKSPSIPLYGRLVEGQDVHGRPRPQWVDTQMLRGVPHDMPIVGFGAKTVNFLRLFSAQTSHDFDMTIFNQGDYIKAVRRSALGVDETSGLPGF
jgi:glycogen phosphorylase